MDYFSHVVGREPDVLRLISRSLDSKDRLALGCVSAFFYKSMVPLLDKEHLFNDLGMGDSFANLIRGQKFLTAQCPRQHMKCYSELLADDLIAVVRCSSKSSARRFQIEFYQCVMDERNVTEESCQTSEDEDRHYVENEGFGLLAYEEELVEAPEPAFSTAFDRKFRTVRTVSAAPWLCVYQREMPDNTFGQYQIAGRLCMAVLRSGEYFAVVCSNRIFYVERKTCRDFAMQDSAYDITSKCFDPFGELPLDVEPVTHGYQKCPIAKGYGSTLVCLGEHGTLGFLKYLPEEKSLLLEQIIPPGDCAGTEVNRASHYITSYSMDLQYFPGMFFDSTRQLVYALNCHAARCYMSVSVYKKVERSPHESVIIATSPEVNLLNYLSLTAISKQEPWDSGEHQFRHCLSSEFGDLPIAMCICNESPASKMYGFLHTKKNLFTFQFNFSSHALERITLLTGPSPAGRYTPYELEYLQVCRFVALSGSA